MKTIHGCEKAVYKNHNCADVRLSRLVHIEL